MKNVLLIAAAATYATFAAMGSAGAQDIYRCGSAYGQKPCAAGTVVESADSRTAAQKAAGDANTTRDAKAADALEKERLKREKQTPSLYAPPAKIEPVVAAKEDKPKLHKPKKPQYFTAVAPAKPGDKPAKKKKASKKARQAA